MWFLNINHHQIIVRVINFTSGLQSQNISFGASLYIFKILTNLTLVVHRGFHFLIQTKDRGISYKQLED